MPLKTNLKWLYLFVILGFIGCKLLIWSPYRAFVSITNGSSFLKVLYTTLRYNPPHLSRTRSIIEIENEKYLVELPSNTELQKLLSNYPPPESVLNSSNSFDTRITSLRSFVSKLLNEKSPLPHSPEPTSALTLIRDKHAKLCSKDAKIFVQYLSALNIPSRMVQLSGHISVDIWNRDKMKWELQDPHFDSDVTFEGVPLSSVEAHKLYSQGKTLSYKGGVGVFNTLSIIPVLLLTNNLTPLHYFSYDNLYYRRLIP